jgi:hypothetical protein
MAILPYALMLCLLASGGCATRKVGLIIERPNTKEAYFSHNGQPLLSFGGLSDFIFYAAEDAYDYKLWADWAADHGINHVRAYPPQSWKHIEYFATSNGGSVENVLVPYEETSPGSRQFDLARFDERYWQRFRRKCEYLQDRGIIIHLLMWNGWQLGVPKPGQEGNWPSHFFNPANNVNACTDHLGADADSHLAIYHSISDGQTELAALQRAWFRKLVDATAGLDNVYYDLVHEVYTNHEDFPRIKPWIADMASTVRKRFREKNQAREAILGMDTGGLPDEHREWIFTRPYFDILVYGLKHTVDQAKRWRIRHCKPYVPQESWDDDWTKYGYREPVSRVHTRKYMWKFMMVKCQQMDLYMKPRSGIPSPPGHPHNYDPRGWSKFEGDALLLRQFWNSLSNWPDLWFIGFIFRGPGHHKLLLSCRDEAIAYMSSATGEQDVHYPSQSIELRHLALADGAYRATIYKPDQGVLRTETVQVGHGPIEMSLPSFVDDIAVHLVRLHP